MQNRMTDLRITVLQTAIERMISQLNAFIQSGTNHEKMEIANRLIREVQTLLTLEKPKTLKDYKTFRTGLEKLSSLITDASQQNTAVQEASWRGRSGSNRLGTLLQEHGLLIAAAKSDLIIALDNDQRAYEQYQRTLSIYECETEELDRRLEESHRQLEARKLEITQLRQNLGEFLEACMDCPRLRVDNRNRPEVCRQEVQIVETISHNLLNEWGHGGMLKELKQALDALQTQRGKEELFNFTFGPLDQQKVAYIGANLTTFIPCFLRKEDFLKKFEAMAQSTGDEEILIAARNSILNYFLRPIQECLENMRQPDVDGHTAMEALDSHRREKINQLMILLNQKMQLALPGETAQQFLSRRQEIMVITDVISETLGVGFTPSGIPKPVRGSDLERELRRIEVTAAIGERARNEMSVAFSSYAGGLGYHIGNIDFVGMSPAWRQSRGSEALNRGPHLVGRDDDIQRDVLARIQNPDSSGLPVGNCYDLARVEFMRLTSHEAFNENDIEGKTVLNVSSPSIDHSYLIVTSLTPAEITSLSTTGGRTVDVQALLDMTRNGGKDAYIIDPWGLEYSRQPRDGLHYSSTPPNDAQHRPAGMSVTEVFIDAVGTVGNPSQVISYYAYNRQRYETAPISTALVNDPAWQNFCHRQEANSARQETSYFEMSQGQEQRTYGIRRL